MRPRDHSHTASPMPNICQRNMTRPWKTPLSTPSAAPETSMSAGTTTIPHASAGSVQRRRQNPRPRYAAATAASVNIASWAGSVQYEWSM